MPAVKSKVHAPGMYVIDVETIPPRNRNNREVHLDYLKHLQESVATLHEILEEARVEKPLDSSLAYACLYTKHSQKLVKYVIGTCPKDFNKEDKQIASTPVIRKNRVTFIDPCETSTNNNITHVKQQTMHQTNEPAIPSTRVKGATAASGSKPRSNTKKDTTLPAKSDMKKVEVHPRNNKYNVKRKNRVDSSISYKRTIINSNSNSVFKTCNKRLMSVNHDNCVVKSVKSVKQPPVKKVCQIKQVKQVWQATRNFMKKFIETVRFGNDHFGAIMGYGDYVIGNSVIFRVQSRGNTIRELREKISRLTKKHSDADPIHDFKALDSQNKALHAKFNALHDLNERWRAKHEKVKWHYKELPVSPTPTVIVSVTSAGIPSSTTIDQDAPSPSHSSSSLALQSPSLQQGVAAESTIIEDNPLAPVDNDPFVNVFALEPSSEA
nr:integrase, catalytic region, zinc finger, CCHC-type, peptidase aspartic, catalytic [Tanacetum cinerariifolium]